jgi:small-conductance mechanosensitive channel
LAGQAAELDALAAALRDESRRAELLRLIEALAALRRGAAAGPGGGGVQSGLQGPPATAAPSPAPAPAPPSGPIPPATASPLTAPPAIIAPTTTAPPTTTPPPTTAPPADPATPAASAPLLAPDTLGAQLLVGLQQRIASLSAGALAAARSLADLPGLGRGLAALAVDPVAQARLLDASWKLALLLGAGLLAEFLVGRLLAGWHRRLSRLPAEDSAWGWLHRLPRLLGLLLLNLLPLLGFVLPVYGLPGLLHPLPTTQLVGLLLAHLYMGGRAGMALARLLLGPHGHLRLIPCADPAAATVLRWLRRILLVGLGGLALAEAGRVLGMPWAAYDAVLRATLLAITLMLVRIILQQRAAVGAALSAPELAEGEAPDGARRAVRSLRDGLAGSWHIVAILWLIACWGVWALEVEAGFHRLFRVSGLTLLLVVLAKLLDAGLRRLLGRAIDPAGGFAERFPGLAARTERYAPGARGLLSASILLAMPVLLLQAWGLDTLGWFARGTLGARLLDATLSVGFALLLALAVWEAANATLGRQLARLERQAVPGRSARLRTLLPMLRTALAAVIGVFVVLTALQEVGINAAPLLAGAGVIGLAIGFGSQKLVQDIITGVFLLLEDAVAVGDFVQLGGMSGTVEQLSIRSIRLRATDGSVHLVPFSAVTTVTNMTRDFGFAVLDIAVGYAEDTDRVAELLREIGAEIAAEPKWAKMIKDDIDVWGVDKLGDSNVVVRARVKTEPAARWAVGREFNRRIRQRFAAAGIEIGVPQQRLLVEAPPPRAGASAPPGA